MTEARRETRRRPPATSRPRQSRLALLFLGPLLLGACASTGGSQQLAPLVPATRPPLDMASPSARDALAEGLRHVARDAPRTRVLLSPERRLQPASGGGGEP